MTDKNKEALEALDDLESCFDMEWTTSAQDIFTTIREALTCKENTDNFTNDVEHVKETPENLQALGALLRENVVYGVKVSMPIKTYEALKRQALQPKPSADMEGLEYAKKTVAKIRDACSRLCADAHINVGSEYMVSGNEVSFGFWDLVLDHLSAQGHLNQGWQDIETAPKDGTKVLVLADVATVAVSHIAWYRSKEEWLESGQYCWEEGLDDWLGWWSYTRSSVTQEKLEGFKSPTHWMPLPQPPESGEV